MSKTKVYIPTYKIKEGRWYYKYPAMSTNKKANQVCEDLLKENKIVETEVVTALIDINKVNNFIKKYNKVALSAEGKKLQLKTFEEFKPDVTDSWGLHGNNLFGTWAPYKVSKNKNINIEQAFYGAMLEDGNGKNVLLRFHNADDKKEQKIIDLLNKNGIKIRKADLGGDNFTPNMIATASAERKFKFKDGSVVMAANVEEAKYKHRVMAFGKSKNRNCASVPTKIIKKLFALGFNKEHADAVLDREQNNFESVDFSNSSESKFVALEERNLGKEFILYIQDEDYNRIIFKKFKTIEAAVKFLEKPGVMFTLKEFVKE